ncbi:MAG: hypothetical protein ACREL9_05150 [Gemmatimonadales bacterium]
MHIELTEMLRCPEPHAEEFLVLSTGEMLGRMVLSGLVGCPACHREYPIVNGVVDFSRPGTRAAASASEPPAAPVASRPPLADDAQTLQALLDLSGPGGFVVLLGAAARHAVGLASLMGGGGGGGGGGGTGIHFVGINPAADVEELPVLSLLRCPGLIPLRQACARGVILGRDAAAEPWLSEARRVLLRGRRWVAEDETVTPPEGITRLASGEGLFVGAKR